MSGKKIKVDPEICTGCRMCEQVCSMNYLKDEINPQRSSIRIINDAYVAYDKPVVCSQCEGKYCKEACPFEAIVINEKTGAAEVLKDECQGCWLCVEACPEGAMFKDLQRGVAMKCDLCGGEPQCIKVCTMKAITY
jgi:carbon-monoxide dehydrogenase iron sulfur subunit